MRSSAWKTFLLSALLIFASLPAFPEENSTPYTPYEAAEFPLWARDLRRFEVVFFGTVPFSFFYASAGYSLYTYASHNWAREYAPAILGNRTPPILTNSEKLQIIGVSLTLSAAAAVVDFCIGAVTRSND